MCVCGGGGRGGVVNSSWALTERHNLIKLSRPERFDRPCTFHLSARLFESSSCLVMSSIVFLRTDSDMVCVCVCARARARACVRE